MKGYLSIMIKKRKSYNLTYFEKPIISTTASASHHKGDEVDAKTRPTTSSGKRGLTATISHVKMKVRLECK